MRYVVKWTKDDKVGYLYPDDDPEGYGSWVDANVGMAVAAAKTGYHFEIVSAEEVPAGLRRRRGTKIIGRGVNRIG